ncbi:MAG: hypothetical protein IPH53_21850 [Flavobacteriales bacterium]|nr:hypothetical protein [Flavobacteriales bacterium]
MQVAAGQGALEVKLGTGLADAYGTMCIVREHGKGMTLHVQPVNTTDTLSYWHLHDLEILTLPAHVDPGACIEQSRTNPARVFLQEGVLNVQPGCAREMVPLFLVDGSERSCRRSGPAQSAEPIPPAARYLRGELPQQERSPYRIQRTKPATVESGRSMTLTF